jgi:peptidoglycan/LPS O-acetylase OafA/YrhL
MTISRHARDRVQFLDAVRGLAALAVLLEHSLAIWFPGYPDASRRFFNLGQFGVTVFFLVSGYIIPASLERSGSNQRFWIGRFFRLYPLYWVCIALTFLVAQVSGHPPAGFNAQNRYYWLVNLTMLQELVRVPHASGVFWTLTLEMALYATCSLLFAVKRLDRSYRLAWLGVILFSLAGLVCPVLLHRRFPAGYAFLPLSAFVGTVIYRYNAGQCRRGQLTALLGGLAIVAPVVAFLNFYLLPRRELPIAFCSVITSWLAAYMTFLALFALRSKRMPAVLLWCGDVSYSIYLLHPLVVDVCTPRFSPALRLPVVLAGSLSLAWLTYRMIEKPMINLGRRWQKPRRRSVPAPVFGQRLSAAA